MSKKKWLNPVVPWASATPEQRALLDATWRAGQLSFLLTPSQQDSYRKIRKWEQRGDGRVYALDISRRWGKSALCATIALEDAIRYQGWRLVYVAPTYEMVRKIILPLVSQLTQSCPPQLAPTWVKSESRYELGNGSTIELIGLDIRPDGARGTGVDKVLLDEAGFFSNLEYLMVSVIYPQMLGRDHARIIAASTPPPTPAHYWSLTVVPETMARGAHDKKTLDEADQYSEEEIDYFYSLMPGGREGTAARREYGAEHIADENLQIVPEFRGVEETIVRETEPPVWRDCYVALDPGYHDLSAVLFGYWDFTEQRLVVEDEIAESRMNSRDLANAIKKKEAALWKNVRRRGPNPYETRPQPYLRICDRDPRLIADLLVDHKLAFVATQKDHLQAQVDQVRVAIQSGRILIHPRCKKLQMHLRHGIWRKVGHLFAREDDDGLKHFDLIAALVYLWRNINKRRNPVPALERFVCGDLPSGYDGQRHPSKWRQEGERVRRIGQRYMIKTGARRVS